MKTRISTLFSILLSNQVLQQEKTGFAPEPFQIQLLLAFSLPYLDTVPVHLGAIRFSIHVFEHCLFEHVETFIIHNLLGKSYTGFLTTVALIEWRQNSYTFWILVLQAYFDSVCFVGFFARVNEQPILISHHQNFHDYVEFCHSPSTSTLFQNKK